jgi:hypothetical protein
MQVRFNKNVREVEFEIPAVTDRLVEEITDIRAQRVKYFFHGKLQLSVYLR